MGCDFFEVSKGKIKVYSKALCSYLSRFGNSSNRLIPASIKSLSPRLLKMLLDAFFYTKNISINDSNNHFRVGSKRLCEDILECLIKIGEWGSIAPDGSEWIINLHHNRTKLLASKLSMSRVPYDGKVYCASVPNKTLVTERNGKILISGNSERKNPKSLIQAYYNEFSFNDPVCLVLKTYRVGNARNERDYIRKQIARLKRSTKGINCPPIILIEDFLNIAEIDSIHHHCDCYVSMARSEGFGIPAFTAASFGNPVIVPNYSAFPEHFNESNGYLIDVTNEVPVTNMRHISLLYTGNMYWGDPSVDSLQSRMREVVNNQGLAKRKGLAARTYIGENLSYKAIGTFLKGYIERINRKAYYGE
jgi:glycosyltransferase involved in cell wall biosynthesis